MFINAAENVEPEVVREGVQIRWLITKNDGAPNFAMRVIELAPGVVFTPHQHPFEHEIYVLEGQGVVTTQKGEFGDMVPGKFLLVPPDEPHGYTNTGDITLKFICVIPNS